MEGVVLINNFNELFDISMMDSEFVQIFYWRKSDISTINGTDRELK